MLIVFTGGPCGGKDSVIGHAGKMLEKLGFGVYVLPEPALPLFQMGMKLKRALAAEDWKKILQYEVRIGKFFIESLDHARVCASIEGREPVFLCNRGIPDNRVYFPDDRAGWGMYNVMLTQLGYGSPEEALREYDMVIHLVTAASGAEGHYTCEGHVTRDESIHAARLQDDRLRKVYDEHPNFRLVDNSTGFDKKIDRALAHVSEAVAMAKV